MEKRDKFLKVGSVIFKVLAWIALILGVVSCIVILVGGGTPEAPRVTSLIGLLLGAIYFFLFYTAGCVIRVLLDIKENIKRPATGPGSQA